MNRIISVDDEMNLRFQSGGGYFQLFNRNNFPQQTKSFKKILMIRAFLFPGQGSQQTGMGELFFSQFPEIVAEADEILGYSLSDLCLNPQNTERLGHTQFTQPALYVVSCLQAMNELAGGGNPPVCLAGHSVGEYAALCTSGAFSFSDGLRLVAKRGEIMAKVTGGGMAAVIGLEPSRIKEVLAEMGADDVDLANFNSPGQTVLSGPSASMEPLGDPMKDAGAKMFVPLKVSGAFHSRMMEEPAREFSTFMEGFSFSDPTIPVISNVKGVPYHGSKDIPDLLAKQIHSSVRWTDTIQFMRSQDVEEFVECGPGKVLTKLLRQIT
jgi:malonyl CoA-acyl carrier protein transacylase